MAPDIEIYVQQERSEQPIDIDNEAIAIGSYSDFTGATTTEDGTNGLVPAPTTADVESYLKGDGTWGKIPPAPKLYTTTGQNEDGSVTQKLFTDTIGDVEAVLHALNVGGGAQ